MVLGTDTLNRFLEPISRADARNRLLEPETGSWNRCPVSVSEIVAKTATKNC